MYAQHASIVLDIILTPTNVIPTCVLAITIMMTAQPLFLPGIHSPKVSFVTLTLELNALMDSALHSSILTAGLALITFASVLTMELVPETMSVMSELALLIIHSYAQIACLVTPSTLTPVFRTAVLASTIWMTQRLPFFGIPLLPVKSVRHLEAFSVMMDSALQISILIAMLA
jgi:hypothetical protein